MNDDQAFGKLVDALRPWLNDLTFVGGWAHRLHRLDSRAATPAYQALATKDADVAFDSRKRLTGSIAQALRDAQFTEVLSGEHTPPVSEYRLGEHGAGFYAEFLTPLSGSGVRRNGASDATLKKAGVTAQKLRHLDVLLVKPWLLTLPVAGPIPVAHAAPIRVANPVCFMAQKLLIRKERADDKRAQDLLYIHDTLEMFAAKLDVLRTEWLSDLSPSLAPNERARIQREWRTTFGAVTDDIRRATRLPADRTLRPEEFRKRCEFGLSEIFAN
jgi:hypothetical protein